MPKLIAILRAKNCYHEDVVSISDDLLSPDEHMTTPAAKPPWPLFEWNIYEAGLAVVEDILEDWKAGAYSEGMELSLHRMKAHAVQGHTRLLKRGKTTKKVNVRPHSRGSK